MRFFVSSHAFTSTGVHANTILRTSFGGITIRQYEVPPRVAGSWIAVTLVVVNTLVCGATYNTEGAEMSRVVYVGMDVDKEKIIVAKLGARSAGSGEERVIANKPAAVKM